MIKSLRLLLRPAFAVLVAAGNAAVAAERIASPDGQVGVTFTLQADGAPTFEIDYLGRPLVLESRPGLAPDFSNGFAQIATATDTRDAMRENGPGDRRRVPGRHRELSVDLRHRSGRMVRLTFRAYDEGIAFRSTFPERLATEVPSAEGRAEFRFPTNTQAWQARGAAGNYSRALATAATMDDDCPLTATWADGRCATFGTVEEGRWKLAIVGRSPAELIGRSDLRHHFAPASTVGDAAWIKPGRVLRDFDATPNGTKAAIDYALAAGFSHVALDRPWVDSADDVPAIVRYGRERTVGVILHVERDRLRPEPAAVFRQLARWGVSGVDLGRATTDPTTEAVWLTTTAALAAQHRLLLLVHDNRSAAGLGRAGPNLFAVADEDASVQRATAEMNCVLPFTRGLFGPIRFFGLRNAEVTRAHRLALNVISSDPLPSTSWSDRLVTAGESREMDFYRRVPTAWDATEVLGAEIGRQVAFARRRGEDWYIGAITGTEARRLTLPLAFLDPGRAYIAHVYADVSAGKTTAAVGYSNRRIFSTDRLTLPLVATGGAALWITPDAKKR